MDSKRSGTIPLFLGLLFIAAGFIAILGLTSFASPCTNLLPNGMARRCYSVGLMQRGIAAAIIAVGALTALFRKFPERVKGLNIAAFLMGVLLVLSATVLTNTCNIRTHELVRGETPVQENRFTHTFPDIENIYIVWTNFYCNTGNFVPFVTIMGIVTALIAAAYAFFADTAAIRLTPSLKNAGIAFIVLGVFALIGLRTFASPCVNLANATLLPVFMRCVDVAATMRGIAAIAIVIGGLTILYSRSRDFLKGLNAGIGLLGVLAFILPFITETCGNLDMPCNALPFGPFIHVVGILTVIVSTVSAVLLNRKDDEDDEDE